MIPGDLAARLRMLTEASFFDSEPPVQGVARVREVQSRLAQLMPGQQVTANIQRVLPDGAFQAVIAGRSYTLALNHAAQAGDSVEIVITRHTAQAVFAQLADAAGPGTANSVRPMLSPTGQLISFLLHGQPAPRAVALAEGQPLLPMPPQGQAAPLAAALRQALAQSGLFYESHQLQWLSGRFDAAGLRREPQAAQMPGQQSLANAAASWSAMPDRLLPLVHQQLEGLASQQYALQGQAWPGQPFELIIDDPEEQNAQQGQDVDSDWQTTLRVSMPQLGTVEARLHLTRDGVGLRLSAASLQTAGELEAGAAQLAQALDAAGLALLSFVVEPAHEE